MCLTDLLHLGLIIAYPHYIKIVLLWHFLSQVENEAKTFNEILNETRVSENRKEFIRIIKTVVLCKKQNIDLDDIKETLST